MKEGIVNVLKPPGMTSSDAVADIRHIFETKRVGHTGTLDPGAAGVLPICVGRATRLFDYLVDKKKEYFAEICFGAATDTQDSYGAVVATSKMRVSAEMLRAVLPAFTGEIEQVAPMFSAVRQDGRKLYELAREGKETVRKVRAITVDAMELIGETGYQRYLLRIVCSKGTYVRTLCHDIGERLGGTAHLSFLLRTGSGAFRIEKTRTIAELREMKESGTLSHALIPMDDALSHMDTVDLVGLNARQERLLRNGAPIVHQCLAGHGENTPLRTYADGEFLGIGIIRDGEIHMHIHLGEEADDGWPV